MRVALAEELGGIGSVKLGELPDPVPAAGQVLVRVHGAGAGPWDVGFLGGGFPGIALPFVPGQEVAGVVEAAGLVIGGGTAYQGLVDRGRLQAGETVLITAAAGGVGSAAVQIAAALGARPLGVASPGNHDYLRGLGASAVFDYHAADWARQALTRVAGRHTRGKIVLRIGQ